MTTETKTRTRFFADYRDEFSRELVDDLQKQAGCSSNTDLVIRAFKALQNELSQKASESVMSGLDQSEKQLVEQALKEERIDLDELMKRGLLTIAKTYVSKSKAKEAIGFSDKSYRELEELGKARSTVRGLAEGKIEKAVKMVQEFNQDQSERDNKLFISADLIYKITNTNLTSIKHWLEMHSVDISEANYGITPKRGLKKEDVRAMIEPYMDR